MKKTLAVLCVIFLLLMAIAPGCKKAAVESESGTVYAMTNGSPDNAVLVFTRDPTGTLVESGSFDTQGAGSGSSPNPLGSQGALCLTKDGKWVLAVNAGSNEISVFSVTDDGLDFASKTSSLGQFPISIATSGNLVFVLNSKSVPPNVTAFTMSNTGTLTAVPNDVRLLTPGNYSQVGFSPDGKWLVVTGESINLILVYSMSGTNPSNDPFFVTSNGSGPAAFAFDKNDNILVAESTGNSVSSYSFSSDGLKSITTSLSTGQKNPLWIVTSGAYAFTVNQGTDNVSSFSISTTTSGQLALLNSAAASGSEPTDMAASSDGKYLYLLDPGSHTVDVFQVGADGSLAADGIVSGLFGVSVQGIAAS